MIYTESDRGFRFYEPLTDTYGGEVSVSESSAATKACIWVRTKDFQGNETALHLTENQAQRLCESIMFAFENHYQKEPE